MRGGPEMSTHHRRPQSRGGLLSGINAISVADLQHRAWTALTVNFHPETICIVFNRIYAHLYRGKKIVFFVKEKDDKIHKIAYSYDKDRLSERRGAVVNRRNITNWNVLFNGCGGDPQRIVGIVNETWLDPDYEMYFSPMSEE